MDRVLNRVCSIENHPVSELDEKFRTRYVKGLGSCLCYLSSDSAIIKMFFDVWAKSVLCNNADTSVFWRYNVDAVKDAIKIQRKGIKLFSMKYDFFFDCFYLLMSGKPNGYDAKFSTRINDYFLKTICGIFTKGALRYTYDYFDGKKNDGSKISCSLREHMIKNENFLAKPEKRILVVANVSAGKSTLINALVGHRVSMARTTACTSKLIRIYNKFAEDGATVKDSIGNYNYYGNIESVDSENFTDIAIHFNSSLSDRNLCFIDTPGFNNAECPQHGKITEEAIKNADYDEVIYVSNCRYCCTEDEVILLAILKKHVKKRIIFVLNQLDCFVMEEESIKEMIDDFETTIKSIGFVNPTIVLTAAYPDLLFKLDKNKLNNIERKRAEMYKNLFNEKYYDLPSYLTNLRTSTIEERTAVTYLENII